LVTKAPISPRWPPHRNSDRKTAVPATARFYRFTISVLVVTLAVIVWGGYVRATGSGAGCGNHWPTCNGEIIPRSPTTKTLVEFTHRLTSGAVLLMIVAQYFWARRLFPRGHGVRRMAALVFVLIIVEALVGGGLVIFEMVAGNTSTARAYWMAAHLLNTFALLAAIGLTIHRAGRANGPPSAPPQLAGAPGLTRALNFGLLAIVLVATSGAVVALGDTLFPARSLSEGFAQDVSPTAHIFLRLRVIHPVLAVVSGLYLLALSAIVAGRDPGTGLFRRLGARAALLVAVQLAVGGANLVLLAPTALQLVHLLLADLVWLSLIALSVNVREAARAHHRTPVTAAAAASA
jgi:heme A synthase